MRSIIIRQQVGHFGISNLGTFALNVVSRRFTVPSIEYPVAGRELIAKARNGENAKDNGKQCRQGPGFGNRTKTLSVRIRQS